MKNEISFNEKSYFPSSKFSQTEQSQTDQILHLNPRKKFAMRRYPSSSPLPAACAHNHSAANRRLRSAEWVSGSRLALPARADSALLAGSPTDCRQRRLAGPRELKIPRQMRIGPAGHLPPEIFFRAPQVDPEGPHEIRALSARRRYMCAGRRGICCVGHRRGGQVRRPPPPSRPASGAFRRRPTPARDFHHLRGAEFPNPSPRDDPPPGCRGGAPVRGA